ncbi:nuclear transport factor 2 family protein [Actinocorallia populi]|uniref:nuclear transport factor 2 family protein n=1 Tax=Actinocorallia populi TaxID=2079200 RepID=UPI000D087440|nr:nuclear transport factor 2 family protein [Actinocorallia populi]
MTLSTGDRVGLADLVARYALHVDRREFDALAGLFASDAVLVLPDPPGSLEPVLEYSGREEARAAIARVEFFPVTSHFLGGQVFDPGPEHDTATGWVSCAAHHLSVRRDGEPADLVWHIRYEDAYRREEGDWRFTRRALHIDWIETRPVRRMRG